MSLNLPQDLEPWTDEWDTPAVYALRLTLPSDFPERWDATYDHHPDFVDAAATAETVLYVGATADVLSRLEDHRDGVVRTASLVSLASDVELRNVWPFDTKTRAFERESGIAIRLNNHTDAGTYVHQR
jgi:predicted GIY-YIG superfamily endonuclease